MARIVKSPGLIKAFHPKCGALIEMDKKEIRVLTWPGFSTKVFEGIICPYCGQPFFKRDIFPEEDGDQ